MGEEDEWKVLPGDQGPRDTSVKLHRSGKPRRPSLTLPSLLCFDFVSHAMTLEPPRFASLLVFLKPSNFEKKGGVRLSVASLL